MNKSPGVYFISFDEAQVVDYYSPKELINFHQRLCKKKWKTASRLYKRNLAGKQKRQKKERIPKIIHQVWLEGPIPESIQTIQKTWKKHHPHWEFHLWTKEEIECLYLQNRPLFDAVSASNDKIEILRYEILYQFGGLFVDPDFECLQAFDILNENCDFYVGLTDQIRTPKLSSSLIASAPGHPIIRRCIRKTRENSHDLTESFFQIAKKNPSQINIALPATFFYNLPKSDEEIPHHAHTFAMRKN